MILNDPQYAIDMMDKKGLIYSDRPKLVMCGELIGWEEGPALSQFGERWSEYRRFLGSFMGSKAKVDAFNPMLEEEVQTYLKNILAEPEKWVEHTHLCVVCCASSRL